MLSRLSILMKTFGILGKDLSEILHVDSSLVSKWRVGRRKLKSKSIYVEKIVDLVMELDRSNNFNNVYKLLANNYKNIQSSSENEIKLFLKSWLTSESSEDQKDSQFNKLKSMNRVDMGIFYKFHGSEGRRQAIMFMVDYAINHAPGIERFSYTRESADWFYEDKEFLDKWKEKNCLFLKNGNFIKVIHPVDRTYKNTAISILSWIRLHMTGMTRALYIPNYVEGSPMFSFFLIPDHLAIFSMYSNEYSKDLITYLTNDATFLESIKDVIQDFFDKSIPMFKRYRFESNKDFSNDLIDILKAKKVKYFYCSTFLFLPLSESLIKEILEYNNNTSQKQISRYIELYGIISRLNLSSLSRYLINLERLQEKLNSDNIVLDSFSFIMGETISVSKELFVKVVTEVNKYIQKIDNIEVGITDSPLLYDLDNINVLTQENTCSNFFCADQEIPLFLMTKELTVVSSLFFELEKVWRSIPSLNRNKEFVCNKIQELLKSTSTERNSTAEIFNTKKQ